MPCQTIRIVAKRQEQRVAEPQKLRLVGRQQAGDGLLNRRRQIARLRLHGSIVVPLGLPPRAQGVARAGDEGCVGGARRRATSIELHVHRGGFGVAGALVVDEQLLDDAGQELRAAPAAAARRSGPAPLILSSTAVALCSATGRSTSRSSASIAASSRRPL